jgi:hypothetical protein
MIIAEVIQRARRRLLWNEIAAQGAYTMCVALGAIVLLLLLGAEILDWRWLAALPAAALVVGICRTLRRIPKPYSTAQLVDRRLKLADTLSTALFFDIPESPDCASEPARQAQRRQAMLLSENLNLTEAIPFAAPRVMYPTGALALIAVSLFALRYGLEHRLDLRPSLSHILKQTFGSGDLLTANLQKKGRKDAAMKRDATKNPAATDLQNADRNGSAHAEATDARADSTQARGSAERREPAEVKPERREEAEVQPNGEPEDSDGGESLPKGTSQTEQQGRQAAGNQSTRRGGQKSGALSGLRDAMQNLLSSMRRQFGGAGNRSQTAMNQDRDGSSPQSSRAGQGRQQTGNKSKSQQGEGADVQNAQEGEGRGAGNSSDRRTGDQPGGGIGNQQGNKDMKLAEQAAARSQISQIGGQRSPDMSGDVTVEVQSGNQQLGAPYTQKNAGHTNAGGEINRDEVPLLYQSYVQQYFEEIRKERTPVAAKRPGMKSPSR